MYCTVQSWDLNTAGEEHWRDFLHRTGGHSVGLRPEWQLESLCQPAPLSETQSHLLLGVNVT